MRVVKSQDELEMNLSIFDGYLNEGTDAEYHFATALLKKGNSFIAYQTNGKYLFAPSRYIGYANNSMLKHESNNKKNGGATDTGISKVLDGRPLYNERLEAAYLTFIKRFGLTPKKIERKFWEFLPSLEFINEISSNQSFPEGKEIERLHKSRERNSQAVVEAKRQFKLKHGRLFCEACGFDFEEQYGSLGKDFIEAHHTIPVSAMKEGHETKIEDLIMLCANCHQMVHRQRPWFTKMQILNSLSHK